MSSKRPAVLITGGRRGIGAAVAQLGAARGYDVAIGYKSDEHQRSTGDAGRVERLRSKIFLDRAGEPDEIAEAVILPMSDAAWSVTGANLTISGGRLDRISERPPRWRARALLQGGSVPSRAVA